jgi:hypothetical protein
MSGVIQFVVVAGMPLGGQVDLLELGESRRQAVVSLRFRPLTTGFRSGGGGV